MAISNKKIKKLKVDYEANKIPITEICKKHGVSRTAIYKLAKKHTWEKYIEKPKTGRPTKYRIEYAEQAKALCLLGYTNERIAIFLGVDRHTIADWKKTHIEFSAAIKEGRETSNAKVAMSLYRRAFGFEYYEVKEEYEGDKLVRKTRTKKHYPPETKAAAMILKNKEPELWRDKQEITVEDRTIRITLPDVQRFESIEDFEEMTQKELGE